MAENKEISVLSFTKKVLNAFDEVAKRKVFKKGSFLLREGEIERNIYLIEKGAVRVFYLSEFEEIIFRLGYDGSIINSLSSFVSNKPSEFYIQTIRQTKVKIISKETLQHILKESQDSLEQYTEFLEYLLIQQIDREIDLLTASPAKRLERVLKRSPDLFQHVPLKYIASYLRMKPETLSRVRNS
ncbi:Crp/Fnr family transcriptional regulator [Fulvivirgaceae bacterium BMA10]|uniref:Crp/Fnr family transcriptional regulator n=1 Tax=Splendidivirga corallicola TaxID=3051826 RepID=A0ABT8KVV8_9BACT|nr:Crp/Fnr family transcriptional regulator [Fulvivirgaceae bacterium BMA10]